MQTDRDDLRRSLEALLLFIDLPPERQKIALWALREMEKGEPPAEVEAEAHRRMKRCV